MAISASRASRAVTGAEHRARTNCGWVGQRGCQPRRLSVEFFSLRLNNFTLDPARRPILPPSMPQLSGVELARGQDDRAARARSDDLERALDSDALAGHQALEVVDPADGLAVDADDQVLGAEAGAGGG
jgi:hypothetical protein